MTYRDTPPLYRRWGEVYPGHSWGAHTFDRLAWIYGAQRAQRIRAGQDEQSNQDLAAWRNLGRAPDGC